MLSKLVASTRRQDEFFRHDGGNVHDPLCQTGEVRLGAVAGALKAGRTDAAPCDKKQVLARFLPDSD